MAGDPLCGCDVTDADAEWSNPNWLFTATINVMWHLHAEAPAQDAAWLTDDLLVAICELELGPWRHIGRTPQVIGLPFTMVCTLLDRLLTELLRVSPGLGARVAIAKAREWLDPDHHHVDRVASDHLQVVVEPREKP
jgi:hypothetical protein